MKYLLAIAMISILAGCTEDPTQEQPLTPSAGEETTLRFLNHPTLGDLITDSRGMTLYTFMEDENHGRSLVRDNKSNCQGQCAVNWPPLLTNDQPTAHESIQEYVGVISRDDGSLQVTYNGKPLYYYIEDKKPGDIYGHEVDSVWYALTPECCG